MRTRNFLLVLLFVLSISWVGHTLTSNLILDTNSTKIISQKDWHALNRDIWYPVLYLHIVSASLAVLTGPLGFSKRILQRHRKFHRSLGKIYIVSVLFSSVTALYLSLFANGGLISVIGFLLLNTLWITTTVLALVKIRTKQIEAHRAWMIRSYALSLANTTLHVSLMICDSVLMLDPILSYRFAVWFCWIANLTAAELLIRRNALRSKKFLQSLGVICLCLITLTGCQTASFTAQTLTLEGTDELNRKQLTAGSVLEIGYDITVTKGELAVVVSDEQHHVVLNIPFVASDEAVQGTKTIDITTAGTYVLSLVGEDAAGRYTVKMNAHDQ